MRPIKFRAYSRSMQKMMPVDLLDMRFPEADGSPRIVANKSLIADGDAELMQFTGLQDEDGRKIYEGDLLRDRVQRFPTVVAFEDGEFVAKKWNGRTEPIGKYLEDAFGFCKVIGNIYENPELLEVTK